MPDLCKYTQYFIALSHVYTVNLQVIWKQLYECSSSRDLVTLYQMRNLINRRNVVNDPTKNVAACEEFFLSPCG